jgi:hypothetical protein
MAAKGKKPHKPAGALPVTSAPYDPLDLRTLAASMAKVVLEQPVHPLAKVPMFEGAGVYILYYTGDYEPYRSIAQKNKGRKWEQPIYVGEAARKGARKGGVLVEGPAGKVLSSRLKNHADSIRNTNNLKLDEFWCRYLAIKDFFIPLCESLLIDRYIPIWNNVIDGFGNKVVGAGREQEQQKSVWDVLHPGRVGAAAKTNKKYPTAEAVLDKLRKFYAGKPVPLITTADAVTTAQKEGEST